MFQNMILSLDFVEIEDFVRKNHVIYEEEGTHYILIDESKKIEEVFKMPPYLRKDYLKFHREILQEKHLNKLINKLSWWIGSNNDETSHQAVSTDKQIEYKNYINILKTMKLDLTIKKIIE